MWSTSEATIATVPNFIMCATTSFIPIFLALNKSITSQLKFIIPIPTLVPGSKPTMRYIIYYKIYLTKSLKFRIIILYNELIYQLI
ncbi:hypothetical protein MSIBF_A3980004 [groundwater metagenome]|uniref:Uncharacterized protein n=1 Tax=groundwater metagenome TaxID=717931 RepID=A0A098EBS6_9ZZZZ